MVRQLNNFELLEKIGDGGMSTVWKACDVRTGRIVAVKVLNRDLAGSGMDVDQFLDEARFLEQIRHPGIVHADSFAKGDGVWYYTMEYVNGYSFGDLLRRKQHVGESDCLLVCESVASALAYAWDDHGIVHCDLKPENIMVNSDGVIKLLDLGISHQFAFLDGPQAVPDHVLGTPAYISPEQVYGDVELDCRADIYALAATLYHLATGRILFPGLDNDSMMRAHCDETQQARDPRAYRPELSEGFCQLLEFMLVKNRDYRVASWQDVFEMCRDVENGVKFKRRDTALASSSIGLLSP